MISSANKSAAGNAGIAPQLAIGCRRPGVCEFWRWTASHVMSMKFIHYPLLLALFFCTNGCMSSGVVKRAKGYTDERIEPLKGDNVFLHGGVCYVIQQKHPQGKNAEKMPPTMQRDNHPPYYAFKPCPCCYSLLLVTAPLDAATLPCQALYGGFFWLLFRYGDMH